MEGLTGVEPALDLLFGVMEVEGDSTVYQEKQRKTKKNKEEFFTFVIVYIPKS